MDFIVLSSQIRKLKLKSERWHARPAEGAPEELDASLLILKSSLSTQLWVPGNLTQSHNENTWKSWFINKNVDHEKWKAASMKMYKTQGEQATIWLR